MSAARRRTRPPDTRGRQQVEGSFLQIATNIANILTQAIQQLRSLENQCWVSSSRRYARLLRGQRTCTSPAEII